LFVLSLKTVENHGNTEIRKSLIFVKCRDFAKMPCFSVIFAIFTKVNRVLPLFVVIFYCP